MLNCLICSNQVQNINIFLHLQVNLKRSNFKTSKSIFFIFYFLVSLFSIQFGVTGGWASPSIVLLLSEESPLPSGKISVDEASWVVSMVFIGGLIGNLAFGLITSHFGRKIPLLLTTIPIIVTILYEKFC